MRKIITWATIVLLLVVCLQSPVMSRRTPYTPEDFGSNLDHPWGGDQNRPRETALPAATATGIPVIDFTHARIFRWLFLQPVKSKPITTITNRNETPTTPPAQSGSSLNTAN